MFKGGRKELERVIWKSHYNYGFCSMSLNLGGSISYRCSLALYICIFILMAYKWHVWSQNGLCRPEIAKLYVRNETQVLLVVISCCLKLQGQIWAKFPYFLLFRGVPQKSWKIGQKVSIFWVNFLGALWGEFNVKASFWQIFYRSLFPRDQIPLFLHKNWWMLGYIFKTKLFHTLK